MTTERKNYLTPTIASSTHTVERGFCVSLEFIPGVEPTNASIGLGIEDMTESTDNIAW